MVDEMHDDLMLDALFGAAKEDANARASSALMARVLAEAEATQQDFAEPVPEISESGFWARLIVSLGGWRPVSGLVVATAAGIWIGVAMGPAVMQGEIGSLMLVSGDESYLSALDESYAMLLE